MSLLRLVAFSAFCLLAGSVGKGGFDFTFNFGGTGSGLVKIINLDTSESVFQTSSSGSTSLANNISGYEVQYDASGLTVTASTSYSGTGDLTVSTSHTRKSELSSLAIRQNGTPEVLIGPPFANYTASSAGTYDFDLTFQALGTISEYQYFFSPPPPALGANGDFDTTSSNPVIPFSYFSSLPTGTNTAFVRIVDSNGNFSDGSFDFDISPSGGSAVPEPSSLLLAGLAAAGLAGSRFRKRRAVKN